LSPHLDDVVLSCSGLIAELTDSRKSVLIATFMTKDFERDNLSDLAKTAHKLWGVEYNPMAQRKKEDILACKILNVDFIHLELYDCIYRKDISNKYMYISQESIFQNIHEYDRVIYIDKISTILKSLPKGKLTFVPLGIGNHVDHVLLNIATTKLIKHNIIYYEDFPYCLDKDLKQKKIKEKGLSNYKHFKISSKALRNKIKAILSYNSQLNPIFGNETAAIQTLEGFYHQNEGEGYWYL